MPSSAPAIKRCEASILSTTSVVRPTKTSLLRDWYTGDYRQIANTKRGHMVGFEDITAEFAPEFHGVKDLGFLRNLYDRSAPRTLCPSAVHTSSLGTVHNLGMLYVDQGKLAEAEAMYQRALKGSEKALGPEHTSTLDTVNNLGLLYSNQGKLAEAEGMYQRALKGMEKTLGREHTSTLDTVHNLGNLYRDQGKLAEAEPMYERALKGKEAALGPEHTSILDTVYNLGPLYSG